MSFENVVSHNLYITHRAHWVGFSWSHFISGLWSRTSKFVNFFVKQSTYVTICHISRLFCVIVLFVKLWAGRIIILILKNSIWLYKVWILIPKTVCEMGPLSLPRIPAVEAPGQDCTGVHCLIWCARGSHNPWGRLSNAMFSSMVYFLENTDNRHPVVHMWGRDNHTVSVSNAIVFTENQELPWCTLCCQRQSWQHDNCWFHNIITNPETASSVAQRSCTLELAREKIKSGVVSLNIWKEVVELSGTEK